ncbi:hypothetical protein Hanom_Chr12g01134561 [Helianthus anomalus]
MRLHRHKIGIDGFELLTLVVKGVLGEVWKNVSSICCRASTFL